MNGNLVKLLWEGAQCWKESMKLLRVAEEASVSKDCRTGESAEDMKAFVAHKRFFSFFSFQKLNTVPPQLLQNSFMRLFRTLHIAVFFFPFFCSAWES